MFIARRCPRSALCIAVSLTAIASTSSSRAQEEEMIITAQRLPAPRLETLAATQVITAAQIERRMATSLFELLGSNAGIQTTRTGGEGSQTSLFMRGTNSDHTLILIDGIKVNTASEGFARLEHLAPEQIERVEIVRGGHSSIHGADAIGGVIQIFTRQPEADAAAGGYLRAGAGSQDSRRIDTGLNFGAGNTHAVISATHQQTAGIRQRNAPVPSTERSRHENSGANVSLQHALDARSNLHMQYAYGEASFTYDGGFSDNRNQRYALGGNFELSEQLRSELTLSHFEDENHTRDSNPGYSRTRRDSLHWLNHLSLENGPDLNIGVDYQDEALRYDTSAAVQTATSRSNVGLFVALQQQFADLSTQASLRRDRNGQFGYHNTGRIAAGYAINEGLSVWYAYSSAFKAPKLIDLYVDFPAFWFYANPELQPETARNHEVSLRAITAAGEWNVSVFQNQIRNLITTNASFDSLDNVGRARIRGAELSASTNLAGWQASAALTLLDHENRDTGKALLRRPDELFNLTLFRQWQQLSVNANWQLRGAQADIDPVNFTDSVVAGSGVLDLTFGWRWSPQFSSQLKLGNLLDKQYQVVDGFNTLGRNFLFTSRYQF